MLNVLSETVLEKQNDAFYSSYNNFSNIQIMNDQIKNSDKIFLK